jgi:anti-sigma regulatory factor (Ser/Thr protein kinase)
VATPTGHLEFKERSSRRIVLHIHPAADFREILTVVHAIRLPQFVPNEENVKYAILELLNNSLRAHRERKVDRRISTMFVTAESRLEVSVKDFGGGFDPKSLPYDLAGDTSEVDHTSEAFQEYQRRNEYLRFGMGLLVARKTFDDFALSFFDEREEPVEWGTGPVCGTLITCGTEAASNGR